MACDNLLYLRSGIPVPCGKCPPCKIRHVNEWVFRVMWEEEHNSISSHFITLTYDTLHVPISANGFLTLRKKDLQNFFKRLRKNTGIQGIKYYACGEYGTKTSRPHYHAIIFNCPDPAAYADAWSLDGTQLGGVDVGNVSADSIAYCLKYIDKDSFRAKRYRHQRDDREREFPLMSQGLGKSYVENKSIVGYHKADLSRNFVTNKAGYRVSMPRYYRQKIYSQGELEAQRDIINVAIEQNAKKDQFFFEPSKEFPHLSDLKQMEKDARVQKFTFGQKRRNTL